MAKLEKKSSGKYTVPQEIRDIPRPVSTEVKRTGGNRYYVYEIRHEVIDNKRKKITGPCIGQIVSGIGFVQNSNYLRSAKASVFDYGQYAVALKCSESVLALLCKHFNEIDAYTIYLFALIQVVNSYTGVTQIQTYFNKSFLSLIYPTISLSYYKLSNLLEDIARKEEAPISFQQELLDRACEIAVDGHVIKTSSKKSGLSSFGYKYPIIQSEQMNLLMAYDTKNKNPVFAKMFPGNELDKTSFTELLQRFNYSNLLITIDRGFYSEENLEDINDYKCKYIIPLSENLKDYKAITKDQKFTGEFLYKTNKHSARVFYKEETIKKEDNSTYKVYLFKNVDENNRLCTSYLENLSEGRKGYTQDTYNKLSQWFGTIVLRTNDLAKEAKDIFNSYKRRWNIETYYDYLKNDYDFNDLQSEDNYQIQGMCFITLVAGLIHSELKKVIPNYKNYNIGKFLLEVGNVHLSKEYGTWQLKNILNEQNEMLKTVGIDYITEIIELNKKIKDIETSGVLDK